MMQRKNWPRLWWGSLVIVLLLALFVTACGPEAGRARNGGVGGSSRPEAPPTRTSAPELFVQPTARIPYTEQGPTPTWRSRAASPGAGTPATPGFGVPTAGPPGTFAPPSPGASPAR